VLRTNVQFSSVDRSARTFVVTSPNPGEGKSVTLANLAVVMAQSGLKVVAVDTDLRRPVLHRIFGISNSRGLSNAILDNNPRAAARRETVEPGAPAEFLLSQSADVEDVSPSRSEIMKHLQPTQVTNLWVLPSGPLPPNPAELLGSERMRQALNELSWADVIMFDTPPALAVTDAIVLGARVDGVLLVYEVGSTRRGAAARAVEELKRVDANVLGAVINRLSPGRDGYQYYYYHNYHYYQPEDGRQQEKPQRRRGLARVLPVLGRSRDGARGTEQ
jgi:Mrp family chromosome partitioning ATPase